MNIIEESKNYVKSLFDSSEYRMAYHNWEHVSNVYSAAKLIADNTEGVNDESIEILELAVIFHDSGFIEGKDEHEIRSASIAKDFLSKHQFDSTKLEEIKRLILATKMGHEPVDLLERIIIDADLAHLGNENYFDTTFKNLLAEINEGNSKKLNEMDWANCNVQFLSEHQFLTQFAQNNFNETKQKNLDKLKVMASDLNVTKAEKKNSKKKKVKKFTKADSPLKGVETMFKVALRNHVNLSQIADNKANTLISVNAIIISIVLSALFPKLDTNPFLFYPGITILLFTILTIILSILSTIPNVNRGLISREEVLEKKGNLLFFGNFYKMSLEDYEWGMNELMNDKDYLYNSMTRDLFFLGKVLNKKYTLLRYSYYSFVFGLLVSVIVFIFSMYSELAS